MRSMTKSIAALGALGLTGLALSRAIGRPAPPRSPEPEPKPDSTLPLEPLPLESAASRRRPPITGGYVLTHEHPMYALAFGGNYAFAGAPENFRNGIMERGYTARCSGCTALAGCDHGEVKSNLTALSGSLGSDMGDHASLKGPLHDSNSHLRYSTEWIQQAFDPPEPAFRDTRLKIMVAFAVENEAMCEQLYYANKGHGGAGGDGYACSQGDSIASLERQLDALKAWAKEHASWMAIAYSAADARRIVNADKLAVILGIESEYSFGAENRSFDPVDRLRHFYEEGVRTFYLAHKINSRLAGADIYSPKQTSAGKAIRATQAISGCFYYDDSIGRFPLVNQLGHNFCDNDCGDGQFKGNKLLGLSDSCASRFSQISEANMSDYVLLRGAGEFNGFQIYPLPPGFHGSAGSRMDATSIERNRLSLSHDGERVVREAMIKGMIVNIDHVSSAARQEIHALATQDFGGYPLNALHNNPNRMLVGHDSPSTPYPHEYDFDDAELDYVRDTGGFFGVRLGPLDAANYPASGVTADCPLSSTESAKILAYLLDRGLHVGYALDYSTITQGVHSRTFRGCYLERGTDYLHEYGSEVAEGLSHVGMMKKWHKELEAVGLDSSYLRQLKNDGPEAFIAMWERAAAKSTVGKQIPRQIFSNDPDPDPTSDECSSDADCAPGQRCGDPIAGKRLCKRLLAKGQACLSGQQCSSGKCSWFTCD